MNEENHIIQFEHTFDLYENLHIIDDINIHLYKLFKDTIFGSRINIHYNNLHIYAFPSPRYNNYNYIINLSNMLYKLHTPHYYSKTYQNKRLI